MTRDEALDRLKQPALDDETVAHEFKYVATKLGISPAELQRYMDAPNKSYRDYKSQLNTFRTGARILKLLGIERVVKR